MQTLFFNGGFAQHSPESPMPLDGNGVCVIYMIRIGCLKWEYDAWNALGRGVLRCFAPEPYIVNPSIQLIPAFPIH